MIQFGDQIFFIGFVYTAVLLPWSLLYFHDFLSERWVQLREARFKGCVHSIIAFIPTPALLLYIVSQIHIKDDPDWKEMFAAISALFFSCFHFIRSIWGLIKLISFKRWAVNAAISFDAASYSFESHNSSNLTSASFRSSERSSHEHANLISRIRAFPDTSTLRTNSSRTTTVTTPRSIEYIYSSNSGNNDTFNHALSFQDRNNAPLPSSCFHYFGGARIRNLLNCFRRLICWPFRTKDVRLSQIRHRVDDMMINNNIVDNEVIGSSAPEVKINGKGKIIPIDPLRNFAYWSVAYLTQLGLHWLEEAKFEQYQTSEWKYQRQALAAEVWGAAVFGMEKDFQGEQSNIDNESILDPNDWKKLSTSGRDDLFSKYRVLEVCFKKKEGMPFRSPIFDDPIDHRRLQGKLQVHINQITNALPADLAAHAENLTPEHLEWFAIFISIQTWKGRNEPTSRKQKQSLQRREAPHISKAIGKNDAPVLLLQDQLGLDHPPPLSYCSFPFIHRNYGKLLWNHKTILQVSARIDNWIALSVGEELENLLSSSKVRERFQSGPHDLKAEQASPTVSNPEENDNTAGSGNSEDEVDQTMFKRHKWLETTRLKYQLVQRLVVEDHHEQCLSFMGCIAETVRSNIAELLFKTKPEQKGWSAEIQNQSIELCLSQQLSQQLLNILEEAGSDNKDQTTKIPLSYSLKERLLWECQNGVHWKFANSDKSGEPRSDSSDSAPQKSIEMIMLFILGFPSIAINSPSVKKDDAGLPVVLSIKPIAAPQDIQIQIKLRLSEDEDDSDEFEEQVSIELVKASLSIIRPATLNNLSSQNLGVFQWQDWRDSFEGRLQGKALWQESHFMRELRVQHTESPITKHVVPGESQSFITWKGWKPFRAGLSTFELSSSALIIVGDELSTNSGLRRSRGSIQVPASSNIRIQTDSSTSQQLSPTPSSSSEGQSQQSATLSHQRSSAYNRASMIAITDAQLHLNGLLRLGSTIYKTDVELSRNIQQADQSRVAPTKNPSSPKLLMTRSFDGVGSSRQQATFSNLQVRFPGAEGSTKKLDIPLTDGIHVTLEKAQRQDPDAMHRLATWFLEGSHSYRRNKKEAFKLLKRALVIGKQMKTAHLYITSLLQIANDSDEIKRKEYVEQAVDAVELLWRDVKGRQKVKMVNKQEKVSWKETEQTAIEDEENRMLKIIKLNRRVLQTRNDADLMLMFATRLYDHDVSKQYSEEAISVLESSIIAGCDEVAMLKLAVMNADIDSEYAGRLYRLAIHTHERKCICPLRGDDHTIRIPIPKYDNRFVHDVSKHKTFQEERGRIGGMAKGNESIARMMNSSPDNSSSELGPSPLRLSVGPEPLLQDGSAIDTQLEP